VVVVKTTSSYENEHVCSISQEEGDGVGRGGGGTGADGGAGPGPGSITVLGEEGRVVPSPFAATSR
jgi:hypothetical protein